MTKFEECDMILKYHWCSVLILNITKWIKSNQLICPDPELLHDMWKICIYFILQLGYVSPLVSLSSSFVIINRLTYTLLLFPNTEPMFRPASVIIIYLHKNIFILSLLFIYQLNGFQNNGICCSDWFYVQLNV